MKTIDTLVEDIRETIKGNGGWDATITKFLSENISRLAEQRFSEPQKPRDYLSLSQIGGPQRKLWYKFNKPELAEELSSRALGTFFIGDILEQVVISLAKASGHTVEGLQEPLEVCGVTGSGDCIIDGWVIDVKSANGRNFDKFKYGQLRGYEKTTKAKGTEWIPAEEVDSYGYISQLSSYLYAYRNDPRVVQKENAAFLAINKEVFDLSLDVYNMKEELTNKEKEVTSVKEMIEGPIPERCFEDVPDGAGGNRVLKWQCGYCDFRDECWSNLRSFAYSSGPKHFTKVAKEPKVPEITYET